MPDSRGDTRAISIALLGEVRLNREALAALLSRDGRVEVATASPTSDGLPHEIASVDVCRAAARLPHRQVGAGLLTAAAAVVQRIAWCLAHAREIEIASTQPKHLSDIAGAPAP